MARIGDFSEINIDNFFSMHGELPFSVYIRLSEKKFTKIFKPGDPIDPRRFEGYKSKGVDKLYIHISERREYIAATERLIKKITQQSELSPTEASRAVEELTEQTIFEIFEDKVFDEQSIRRSTEIVNHYLDLMKKDIRGLAYFITLSKNESYLCRHSIATAVFGILLARADQNLNDKILKAIGLGGLLHDVGMSQLPDGIDDIDRKLTDDEWRQIKRHPYLGAGLVANIKGFPVEVQTVIEQHHECWDGSGYPKGIRWDDIFYPARVISITDSFSALTTRRGGRALYSPDDAIALMQTESGKYDPKLLKLFGQLLLGKKKAAA